MNRRELLASGAAALATLSALRQRTQGQPENQSPQTRIPILHITDLYHPPQDPDDHIDLATILAINEYDLKGVILDVTDRFLHASPKGFDIRRDPGFVPVVQIGYLLGRSISVAAGPTTPLRSPRDDATGLPPREQAGIDLFLDILRRSDSGVVVSITGSCRVITAAYNRNPDLLHTKIQSVLLNAGATAGHKQEWNVGLDPEAYVGLWQSGLPIHWYPCATDKGAFDPGHERGTFWKTTHAAIFRDLAPPLQSWFAFALTRETRGDFINALSEFPSAATWKKLLAQERNLWATASLALEAGRMLAKTAKGWRFVKPDEPGVEKVWHWRLDDIRARVNERSEVEWHTATENSNASLFWREPGDTFGQAMSEALCALLAVLLK